MSVHVGEAAQAPDFPSAAQKLMANTQLRHNVRHATDVIRRKRARVVGEMSDWQQLREAGQRIKDDTLRHLDHYLLQFEEACTRAGGKVHWARDADEANCIVIDLIRSHHQTEVIKVKTMTSDETGLNKVLHHAGVTPYETDLADLIVQLGEDKPSHIVVPALHRNRMEIRQIFLEKMNLQELGDRPEDLTAAARNYLREKFLRVKIGISGANFAVAENRVGVRGGVGRQRAHVRLSSAGAHQPRRNRENGSHFSGSRSFSATASALGDGRADESVQFFLDRHSAG